MRFDILTIFPKIFDSYFNESILKRAQKKKLIRIRVWNLRDFTTDKHQKVDDKPFGGGPGMVMKVEPFYHALRAIKSKSQIANRKSQTRIILTSAKGKTFTQKDAVRLAKYKRIVLLCGRYEGVDERVAEYLADEEISIGNYILTGGEVPAMVIVDAVSRHVPGVLGRAESLEENRQIQNSKFKIQNSSLGYPQYTRPEVFRLQMANSKWQMARVPKVLLSGDHKKIAVWRARQRKSK